MCNVSKLLKYILFADDTNIFHSHRKLPDLVSELNTELDKMYKWFCVNKLSLNIAKTNYILFGRYTYQQDVAIVINNVTIQRVQATKFLGVLKGPKREKLHAMHVKELIKTNYFER